MRLNPNAKLLQEYKTERGLESHRNSRHDCNRTDRRLEIFVILNLLNWRNIMAYISIQNNLLLEKAPLMALQ